MTPIQRVYETADRRNPAKEVMISNFWGLEPSMLTVITDVANMIRNGKDDLASLVVFERLLRGVGAFIFNLSDELILIYQAGDPDVEEIFEAPIRKLPELLTSENSQVRLLAKWRLDTLINDNERYN